MKYYVCGQYVINVSEGVEPVTSAGLTVECDSEAPFTVTRDDGMQFCTVFSGGKAIVPREFLSASGRFTVQFGTLGGSAFSCFFDRNQLYASRCNDSFSDEITHMWIAIAEIMQTAREARKTAASALSDVETFRRGYITE